MELFRLDCRAAKPDPLTRQDLHVGRSIELDLEHIRGQELRLQDVELHVSRPQRGELVDRVDDAGNDEKDPEPRRARQPREAVEDAKYIEEDVELVGHPEEVEGLLADSRMGKHKDEYDYNIERDPGQAGQRLE